MTADELVKKPKKKGWYEVSQEGSHKKFRHPNSKEILIVPYHQGKDIKKGLLMDLLKMVGLK